MRRTILLIILLTFVLVGTTGCTVLGFAWGNVYDERMAMEKVSPSDTVIAECKKGDVVFLTDQADSTWYGRVLTVKTSESISLEIKNESSFHSDTEVRKINWADVKSLHVLEPHHYGMFAGIMFGVLVDFLVVMLGLALGGYTVQ